MINILFHGNKKCTSPIDKNKAEINGEKATAKGFDEAEATEEFVALYKNE